jgi:hypothetical protein
VPNDGRQHRGRRFREPLAGPTGSENPCMRVYLSMRENREVSRSPIQVDGRVGRTGKVKAVIL